MSRLRSRTRKRLIFAGKQLEDGRTLADYNIQKGFNSINSKSIIALAGAPGPAPETKDPTSVLLHYTVQSNDGAAPNLAPPKSTEQFTGAEFSFRG